ncbi:hypothetical protein [Amphibacillus cookii]|uniref:hypothetical protein n=1 Tax=Amphibacillus cookii TaxID=767787 RepID=UPI0019599F40|nr:hypothetical protein [Amphibacillus cookii]MBM7542739.1 peptidoglycan hydrolase CwlO-like protein [Amphibacillus cookii]
MSNQARIMRLNQEILRNDATVSWLLTQNVTYRNQIDDYGQSIYELEKQLEDILERRKEMDSKLIELEALTEGEGSPMGRIQLVEAGLLESKVLNRIQESIMEVRNTQERAIIRMKAAVNDMDRKANQIEERIEERQAKQLHLNQLLSTNQANIQRLKYEITVARQTIRTL